MSRIALLPAILCLVSLPALAQTNAISASKDKKIPAQENVNDFKLTKKDFIANVEGSFDSMDKNHDGVLSMDELMSVSGQVPPELTQQMGQTAKQMPKMPSSTTAKTPTPKAPEPIAAPIVAATPEPEPQPQKPAVINTTPETPKFIPPASGIPPVNSNQISR